MARLLTGIYFTISSCSLSASFTCILEESLPSKKIPGEQSAKTKFYEADCTYKYPDGYIIPFICALHELIVIDKESVRRGVKDITNIIKNNLLYSLLIGAIKENHFDPVKVGKSPVAYSGCEMALKMMLINQ